MSVNTPRSRFLVSLLAGLVLGALNTHAEIKQGTAVVKALAGTATYTDAIGFNHPVQVGTTLKEGDTIKTGADTSVDLFLDQNGPGIGLNANSTLRFEKLSYQDSILGDIIDTRLDLKEGQLVGTVDKLIAGSRYEVKMPTGVAVVRGTEFFIDASRGTVYVTAGTITVKVVLKESPGVVIAWKNVTVGAGFTLYIPNEFKNTASFDALAPVPTPSGLSKKALLRLATLGKLTLYTGKTQVTETFAAQRKRNGQIKVTKPPLSIVASP